MDDPDMAAGLDADGDCLANAADAQPGQPTDTDDSLNGTLCPVLPYSEAPNLIQNDTATDQDCDGLVDGVEVAWGSDETLADTDGDGATDFVEMFQFTNPNVQDTDGDGVLDKPEDDYIAAIAGAAESDRGRERRRQLPVRRQPDPGEQRRQAPRQRQRGPRQLGQQPQPGQDG